MRSKEKIKTSVIRTDSISNEGYEYLYRLTSKESESVASYRMPLYSIHIELKTPEGLTTERCAKDCFADIGKALVFYDRIVKNLITPINLPYFMEDELN